jgi:hypothetical protein
MTPPMRRMLETLIDGNWHDRDVVLRVGAILVPPGVAYRLAERQRERSFRRDKPDWPEDMPIPERTRGDKSVAIASGQRRVALDLIHGFHKRGKLEQQKIDGTTRIRLTSEWVEELRRTKEFGGTELTVEEQDESAEEVVQPPEPVLALDPVPEEVVPDEVPVVVAPTPEKPKRPSRRPPKVVVPPFVSEPLQTKAMLDLQAEVAFLWDEIGKLEGELALANHRKDEARTETNDLRKRLRDLINANEEGNFPSQVNSLTLDVKRLESEVEHFRSEAHRWKQSARSAEGQARASSKHLEKKLKQWMQQEEDYLRDLVRLQQTVATIPTRDDLRAMATALTIYVNQRKMSPWRRDKPGSVDPMIQIRDWAVFMADLIDWAAVVPQLAAIQPEPDELDESSDEANG